RAPAAAHAEGRDPRLRRGEQRLLAGRDRGAARAPRPARAAPAQVPVRSQRGVGRAVSTSPCAPLRVLQCGFPKSGNYGVRRLLQALLAAHGRYASFKRRSGLARIAETLGRAQLAFPEAAEVDAFSFASGACQLELQHPDCRWVPVDPALLVAGSTLLWTHDPADVIERPELAAVTHRVYVLRDGRDVLESLAHHVVRPEIRRLHPEYRHTTAEAVLADLPLVTSYARRWAE